MNNPRTEGRYLTDEHLPTPGSSIEQMDLLERLTAPANVIGYRNVDGREARDLIEALTQQLSEAREALNDVVNPLGYLQRMAEAKGNRLSGRAYAIANDIGTLKGIARDAIERLSSDQ